MTYIVCMETNTNHRTNEKHQGSKWIRKEKRLAIYLRDGLACCYCGATIEDGAMLTLDHIECCTNGGSNAGSNLVTACRKCNSSRGTRSVESFATSVAEYLNHGVTSADITDHIATCIARKIDVKAAKELISRRGSYAEALNF